MAATRDYAIGQQLVRQAGDHQIIATIGVDSVNVTVWRGMHRIDGWSHTYPTQAEAFAEAHRARLAFERYDTAEANAMLLMKEVHPEKEEAAR